MSWDRPPKLSATASRSCHRRIVSCGHRQHPVNNLTTRNNQGQREVAALMASIREVDPLPFAHENSEWVELFDSPRGGMYT